MIKKSVTKKAAPKKSLKKSTVSSSNKPTIEDPSLQILQTSKCRTISDKSELTANIAVDDKGTIQVRINNNTGGGYWSREWVSFDQIISTLSDVPEDKPITSIHLFKLFAGKSSNSPGFLLAFLLNERLVESFQGKKRQYALTKTGVEKFQAKIDKLKSSKS
jgi:hypothetical protein